MNTQQQTTETVGAPDNAQKRDRFASHLEAKCAAVNKINAEAKRLQPLFVEAFRPFVGKKILTHTGLSAKTKDIPDTLVPFVADGYTTPGIYRNSSNYSLSFNIKISVPVGEYGCVYAEATIYVGELDGYNLKSLIETTENMFGRTDWTPAEVTRLRNLADTAEKEARGYASRLSEFGRYDR